MSNQICLDGVKKTVDQPSIWRGNKGSALVQTWSSTPVYTYGIVDITPVATPTDFIIIQGSATKTLKIQSIVLSLESTASGSIAVRLIRRSAANTVAATLNPIFGAPNDPNDAPATATVGYVSGANFTNLGTQVGGATAFLGAKNLNSNFQTSGFIQSTVEWSFEQMGIKPILLFGTSDFICINLNGDTVPAGGKIYADIKIEEDNSAGGG